MLRSLTKARWAALVLVAALAGCDDDDDDGGAGEVKFEAPLSGANVVPTVATLAAGDVVATLRDRTLTVTGSFDGLESDLFDVDGSPAHLHDAAPGSTGDIVIDLEVTSADRRKGTLAFTGTLTDAQAQAFREGRLYADVHTSGRNDGELRAQLSSDQPELESFLLELAGGNEVPKVTTDATGTARVTRRNDVLVVAGTFEGLGSDALDVQGSPAHVHQAAAGQNGPIVFNLDVAPGSDRRSGRMELIEQLTEEQVQVFDDRGFYLNVHSADHPGGELRAQVSPTQAPPTVTTLRFESSLGGANEAPPVETTATGEASVTLTDSTLTLTGEFDGLSSPVTEAHIHEGAIGVAGPVLIPLEVTTSEPGRRSGTIRLTTTLTEAQRTALVDGNLYVNVHSSSFPAGEIRGQLFARRDTPVTVTPTLSGASEVPPVTTAATGSIEARRDGAELTVTGTFSGLESDLLDVEGSPAHVHVGAVGVEGPIELPITVTAGPDNRSGTLSLTTTLTDEQRVHFDAGSLYVNVHTTGNPEGEIRAQISPPSPQALR